MTGTINFVLIGARNTGKTCYLSVLSCHCPGITVASDETTAYLKLQRQALDAGELPPATASSMRELFFRYTGGEHKIDFSIDDYDGSFIESLSRVDAEDDTSRLTLKDRIQESEGLLFFMPYEPHPDPDTLSNFESEINTIISLAEEITDGKYASLPIPVAICISKWDRSPDYQSSNEEEAALTYLNDNPCYQRVTRKINKLFRNVSIHPISAFGTTEDGRHPIKGKVTPYHLEAPLEFCLDKTFHRFGEKIEEFQQKQDDVGLLAYLFGLYHDLKHYRSGKYCQMYDDLEKKFAEQLLGSIKNEAQLELTDDQQEIYDLIRQEELRRDIDQTLQSHRSGKKRKRIWMWITAVTLIIGLAGGGGSYQLLKKEKKELSALRSTITDQTIPLAEILSNVSDFQHHWGGWIKDSISLRDTVSDQTISLAEMQSKVSDIQHHWVGLIKDNIFEADRNQMTLMTSDEIRKRLYKLSNGIDDRSLPDKKIIHDMEVFQESVRDWQDESVYSTVESTLNPILNSYHVLERLRDQKNKAEMLDFRTYAKLKKEADAVVMRWSEFNDVLKQIHTGVSAHIKLEASDALISKDQLDLERSAENLEFLSADGDVEAATILKLDIQPALNIARREESFRQLLSSIGSEFKPSNIKESLSETWLSEYTDENRAEIKQLLQKKFAAYESQSMPSVRDLQSKDQIKEKRGELKEIADATSIVVAFDSDSSRPFSFRYQRDEALQSKFDDWKDKLAKYEQTLHDGINVYITFQGNGSEDDVSLNPLDFNCSMNDHDLELTIDESMHFPDDDQARGDCKRVDASQTPSLKWKNTITLKQGSHTISVIEHELTVSNDEWNRSFKLNNADFFTFINKGEIVKQITPYTLILSKH